MGKFNFGAAGDPKNFWNFDLSNLPHAGKYNDVDDRVDAFLKKNAGPKGIIARAKARFTELFE